MDDTLQLHPEYSGDPCPADTTTRTGPLLRRDALLVLALAAGTVFVLVLELEAPPHRVLYVGSLTGAQIQVAAEWAGPALLVAWVITRLWVNGGSPRGPIRVLTVLLTWIAVLAGLVWSALLLLFFTLSGDDHVRLSPAGSDETYLFSMDSTGYGTIQVLRGGPFLFRQTYLRTDDIIPRDLTRRELTLSRSEDQLVLRYADRPRWSEATFDLGPPAPTTTP